MREPLVSTPLTTVAEESKEREESPAPRSKFNGFNGGFAANKERAPYKAPLLAFGGKVSHAIERSLGMQKSSEELIRSNTMALSG